jgi:hypothetical protein
MGGADAKDLTVKFIHGEPAGGGLLDLLQLLMAPTEDQELLSLSFQNLWRIGRWLGRPGHG